MKTIGELVVEAVRARHLAQAVEPAAPEAAPAAPAAAPIEPAKLEPLRAEYREKGRNLFAAFDERQRRVLEAEIVMAQGRRNPEERSRLAVTVRALREWMHGARDLGILPEFEREIRLFMSYLKYEADEAARAEKVGLPWRTRFFLESGEDVVTATRKPVQYLDFDFSRLY